MTTRVSGLPPAMGLGGVALAALVYLSASTVSAQSDKLHDRVAFEVASVKLSDPDDRTRVQPAWGESTGRVILRNIRLKPVLIHAFGLQFEEIDGPGWLDEQQYEILASAPAGAPKELIPVMLQTILTERFGLRFHRESKIRKVYALIVGKGGPKLKESRPSATVPEDKYSTSGTGEELTTSYRSTDSVFGTATWTLAKGNARFDYEGITMADLARLLSQPPVILGLPVVDMTGLEGKYRVTFGYPVAAMKGTADDPDLASDTSTSLIEYLHAMGLDLARRELPVERFVIDHIEKTPTPN
jgi:uncharacterized protein (TIGR03435 family)